MIQSALNMVETARLALNLPETNQLTVLTAESLREAHCPPFPVDKPAWIVGIHSLELAQAVQAAMLALYPAQHELWLINCCNGGLQQQVNLVNLSNWPHLAEDTLCYLPPLARGTSVEAFHEIVAHLRAPNGCPWDRKQTHASLRTYLLEETYEALAALDANDAPKMREEFGDILLQILLHAEIAHEAGTFNLADVVQTVHDKIIYRHPHVFGDVQVEGVSGVLVNWEKLKAEERAANGDGDKGMLDSVPTALPALSLAQEYQARAARVGFDWTEMEPMLAKIQEEMVEVREAPDAENRAKELGDLLFAVVNLVRWYSVDAESTLRETNQRFRKRFQHIERRARETGRVLTDMTLPEMDVFWEEAKELE